LVAIGEVAEASIPPDRAFLEYLRSRAPPHPDSQ
jgi:hypothetical protein